MLCTLQYIQFNNKTVCVVHFNKYNNPPLKKKKKKKKLNSVIFKEDNTTGMTLGDAPLFVRT